MLPRVAAICALALALTTAAFAASRVPVVASSADRVKNAVVAAKAPHHIVRDWLRVPIRRALDDAKNPRDRKPRLY